MLDQPASETTDDYIVSCAFYEGANNEWLERELLFTGHKRGLVNVGTIEDVALFVFSSWSDADALPDLEQDHPPRALRA